MKLEKLVGERFKEKPSDCSVDSHALMVRGGYMKYVANGIFSSYMPLKRITRKIEQILREEMDKIDGQEVSFPVVMPASLWQESGRYESIGKELVRFSDRNGSPVVLGMTHEEAAVQLVREYGQSYMKYPFMIYQIQTKFRDEARPKSGLIRVREFTMKDAYSFHTSQADLEQYYDKCHKAYERIFARAGIPEVVSVASESGMMGGSISHEFMLLTDIGEDSIVICPECNYRANMEAAENIIEYTRTAPSEELKKVYTPNIHTIEEVCAFLGCDEKTSCKAVVYQRNSDDKYIVLFLRGDLEVNETKLTNYLGFDIHPALITLESGLKAGYIGPVGLDCDAIVLYDNSLKGMNNLSCGANEEEYHYTVLDMDRDVPAAEYHDFSKIQGRFNTRLSLSSSSVDEVIKKRILAKTDNAANMLAFSYSKNSAVLKNLFTFNGAVLDLKGYSSEYDFVETRSKDGVCVRVYTPVGKAEQGKFALEVNVLEEDCSNSP